MEIDVDIQYDGFASINLLTDRAKTWAYTNINSYTDDSFVDDIELPGQIPCDSQYVRDITIGMLNDGLVVTVNGDAVEIKNDPLFNEPTVYLTNKFDKVQS